MILVSQRVVVSDGVRPAAVTVEGGEIVSVDPPRGRGSSAPGEEVVDLGELALLPGVVDTHVHVNEPGRTEWEGFAAATRAAAAGGITTLVDMPLNCSPVTTTVETLRRKLEAAQGSIWVDCGFWGGIVSAAAATQPDEEGRRDGRAGRQGSGAPTGSADGRGDVEALHDAGVLGFKCFLCPSGLDEFPHLSDDELEAVLPTLARLGVPLLVHAEDPEVLDRAAAEVYGGADASGSAGEAARSAAAWAASRPPAAEVRAIERLARLGARHGARIHVVHVAAAEALETIRRARADGVEMTAETCPHYLTFAVEDIPDGATAYKCAPPIRDAGNRERLWEGLADGSLDLVASDHSPCPPAMKLPERGDFLEAWGGISSLQVGLPALWSGAVERGFGLAELARWTAATPARLAGLDGRKGAIAVGHDADLIVFDPEAELVVEPDDLWHRHPLTPYAGRRLRGRVLTTFLRGRPVYARGEFPGGPSGRLLLRDEQR